MKDNVYLSIKNLYKYFGKTKVLQGVSCDIKKGEKIGKVSVLNNDKIKQLQAAYKSFFQSINEIIEEYEKYERANKQRHVDNKEDSDV